MKDFHQFLNSQQRDPRLNEILHPLTFKDQASKIIAKYEREKSGWCFVHEELLPRSV